MTRIRYKNEGNGIWKSVRTIVHPSIGARYQVTLDQNNLSYSIFEELTEKVVSEGRAVNFHQVKIKVKQKLELFGVEFHAEEKRQVNRVA